MSADKFEVGERVTYFPIKQNAEDNRHWPAKVLSVGKRYKVEIAKPGGGSHPIRLIAQTRATIGNGAVAA